jgi:hypothetical protein
MSRTTLVLTDLLFVVVLIMIYNSNGLRTYPLLLAPLIIVAFATCVIRHINYYNMTKKIF